MTYVLEKIQPIDAEKILRDAEPNRPISLSLLNEQYFKNNQDLNWAIDRSRNMYLLGAPVKPWQEVGPGFLFYFKGVLQEFNLQSHFHGNLVIFPGGPSPTTIPSIEFKEELTAAFAVFGRQGLGPNDGNPGNDLLNAITPEFQEGDL
ncbi:hypothetical protein [Variovorax rhizosphaerae]|uniref:Uncharacterized protein n=1 Tax=Variovorax rhizosphaerae TaxID=1836200 RepID=A0ABU8WQ55_9BURK